MDVLKINDDDDDDDDVKLKKFNRNSKVPYAHTKNCNLTNKIILFLGSHLGHGLNLPILTTGGASVL